MAGAYTLGTDVYADYMRERAASARGPVGDGPATGARTMPGRTAEGAFGMGRRDGAGGEIPWLWIGAGVLAVILIARR